jgi:hypothetical protein
MITLEQIEEARAGRNISDIPVNDSYYDLVNARQMEEVDRAPGVGERKVTPIEEKANRIHAMDIDEAKKEQKRKEEEDEEDDDKDFDSSDDDDDDDDSEETEESKVEDDAPKPPTVKK